MSNPAQREWLKKLATFGSRTAALATPLAVPTASGEDVTDRNSTGPILQADGVLSAGPADEEPWPDPPDAVQRIELDLKDLRQALEEAKKRAMEVIANEGATVTERRLPKPGTSRPSRIGDIQRELRRIAGNPASPNRHKAQQALDNLEGISEQTAELERQKAAAIAARKGGTGGTTKFNKGGNSGEKAGKKPMPDASAAKNPKGTQQTVKPSPTAPPKSPSTTKKTPTTGKSPAKPPTSPPPPGGGGSKGPPLVKLSQAQWQKGVNAMRKVGGVFKSGYRALASTGVQGMLQLVGGIFKALEAMEGALGEMTGSGSVFRQQVAHSESLGGKVMVLVNNYKAAGYHDMLGKVINLAREFDKEDPDALYGSDELSNFCAGVRPDVETHERECQQLLDDMTAIYNRVTAGEQLCSKLLGNVPFMTAAEYTGHDLTIYLMWQDFRKISGTLHIHLPFLKEHLALVGKDLERIKANIIDSGLGGIVVTDE